MNPEAPLDDMPEWWPPPDEGDGFGKLVLRILLVFLITFVLIAIGFYAFGAQAHVKGWSDADNQWLAQQGSAIGICCSGSEAYMVQDPDWVETNEDHFTDVKGATIRCQMGSSQDNLTPSKGDLLIRYCVRIGNTWWAVPDGAVVKSPNRLGMALVWPMFSQPGGGAVTYIRCFMPGTSG